MYTRITSFHRCGDSLARTMEKSYEQRALARRSLGAKEVLRCQNSTVAATTLSRANVCLLGGCSATRATMGLHHTAGS